MSNLSNKSEIFQMAAQTLHNKNMYPAVAHDAYYSCYQLMKHIWLYSMKKTQRELDVKCSLVNAKSHEFLLNEIVSYVKKSNNKDSLLDSRILRNDVLQLKRLRVDADYYDSVFDSVRSNSSITLSQRVIPILKKY